MSLYGDSSIKIDALKAWAKELDEDTIISRLSQEILAGKCSTTYRTLLQDFKKAIEDLKEGDDWRSTKDVLNIDMMPAIFMVSDNAIRVGNYYECLVTYADVTTKKKLINGFQYKNIGEINIRDNVGNAFGQIGMKSDLIWSCLYQLFIHDDIHNIEHTLPDHEEIMSIQLTNTFGKTDDDIRHMTDEIIYKCSEELNLNFQYCHLDPQIREEGVQGHYELNTTLGEYENVPMMYFNSALSANDVRIKFLSYYQVMEFYFNRAQNIKLLNEIKAGNYTTSSQIDHMKLKSVLKGYVSSTKEIESLKLVLMQSVDVAKFKKWVNAEPDRVLHYTNSGKPDKDINLLKTDEKIISKLADRIYSIRCSIAHAKGDIDEYIALPEISSKEIEIELPLVRYVAIETIKRCSRW